MGCKPSCGNERKKRRRGRRKKKGDVTEREKNEEMRNDCGKIADYLLVVQNQRIPQSQHAIVQLLEYSLENTNVGLHSFADPFEKVLDS